MTAINNNGEITGEASFPNLPSGNCPGGLPVSSSTEISAGFVYQSNKFTSIQYPGACETIAVGINNNAQIIGIASMSNANDQTELQNFLFSGATFTAIDLPSANGPEISGIDDSDVIVGTYTQSSPPRAFIDNAGQISTLAVPGATSTAATGINNAGQVYGGYGTTAGEGNWIYSNQAFSSPALPSLQTPIYIWGNNDDGEIIGRYGSGCQTSFSYLNGTTHTIAFPGSSCTQVYGVNNLGQIVGVFVDPKTGLGHGFLATPTGK